MSAEEEKDAAEFSARKLSATESTIAFCSVSATWLERKLSSADADVNVRLSAIKLSADATLSPTKFSAPTDRTASERKLSAEEEVTALFVEAASPLHGKTLLSLSDDDDTPGARQ
jgi:hypothetical protein